MQAPWRMWRAVLALTLGVAGCGAPGGGETDLTLAREPQPALAPVVGDVVEAVAGDGAGEPATRGATAPASPPTSDAVLAPTPPGPTTSAVPTPAAPSPGPPAPAAPATAAPAPATAPVPPVVAPPVRPVAAGLAAYAGLGTWVDVYDWSRTFGKDGPLVEVADIDRMADVGVQTLYIQTSRWNVAADILEPERLEPLIARARSRGLSVVAWYLPTFVDPAEDLRRLVAAAALDVDGVGVDIESRDLADTAERNRRLVELSRSLRQELPGVALSAIVFPPVVMDVINTSFWPGFPWAELAPHYDVWVPMAYQSFRTAASGYRDGARYTAENIDRLRGHVGAGAVVHTVGGIADATTAGDVEGMIAAAGERGAIGGSLYDWRTTAPGLWPHLQGFRR